MQELHPCTGCEYFNKPYRSVVSPCSSCPKIHNTGGYVTTTTTAINSNLDTKHLPTAEEYQLAAIRHNSIFPEQWSEPKYQCPECGGGMCKNLMVVCTSLPPKYEYRCDRCGHVEYQYI